MNPFSRAPAERASPPPPLPPGAKPNVKPSVKPTATQLHELYLDDVFRYAARRLKRREDAEDATAETFAAAFAALPKYRGDVEPKLWLLGIARRKVADALRRRERRPETAWDETIELPAPQCDPARHFSRGENARQMRELLGELKPDQREALLLKYVENLRVEEIAVVMNRSKGAANSLLQRARAAAFARGQSYFLDHLAPAQSRSNDNLGEVKP